MRGGEQACCRMVPNGGGVGGRRDQDVDDGWRRTQCGAPLFLCDGARRGTGDGSWHGQCRWLWSVSRRWPLSQLSVDEVITRALEPSPWVTRGVRERQKTTRQDTVLLGAVAKNNHEINPQREKNKVPKRTQGGWERVMQALGLWGGHGDGIWHGQETAKHVSKGAMKPGWMMMDDDGAAEMDATMYIHTCFVWAAGLRQRGGGRRLVLASLRCVSRHLTSASRLLFPVWYVCRGRGRMPHMAAGR